ncbi:hypothetical protein NC797_04815 [Aquibacillus sp. 3ASR75-11]|uniref:HMA domain-containing protein n=1 Tax=Terrihalobacillus insolitus TaxID=2950438 RepID=A0A9X3WT91_9BACI|nr:hypothetical protein [Terrihalobacillus insolitus]MDC3412692.1 hypothetical protein [Terrihalobacillus insolitus]MDC3423831.1 hypothetical protein [Terrihalobacillus insolitus]
MDGVKEFKVEVPPKDQAFVIFDPANTDVEILKQAIKESGYKVKTIEETA